MGKQLQNTSIQPCNSSHNVDNGWIFYGQPTYTHTLLQTKLLELGFSFGGTPLDKGRVDNYLYISQMPQLWNISVLVLDLETCDFCRHFSGSTNWRRKPNIHAFIVEPESDQRPKIVLFLCIMCYVSAIIMPIIILLESGNLGHTYKYTKNPTNIINA